MLLNFSFYWPGLLVVFLPPSLPASLPFLSPSPRAAPSQAPDKIMWNTSNSKVILKWDQVHALENESEVTGYKVKKKNKTKRGGCWRRVFWLWVLLCMYFDHNSVDAVPRPKKTFFSHIFFSCERNIDSLGWRSEGSRHTSAWIHSNQTLPVSDGHIVYYVRNNHRLTQF